MDYVNRPNKRGTRLYFLRKVTTSRIAGFLGPSPKIALQEAKQYKNLRKYISFETNIEVFNEQVKLVGSNPKVKLYNKCISEFLKNKKTDRSKTFIDADFMDTVSSQRKNLRLLIEWPKFMATFSVRNCTEELTIKIFRSYMPDDEWTHRIYKDAKHTCMIVFFRYKNE